MTNLLCLWTPCTKMATVVTQMMHCNGAFIVLVFLLKAYGMTVAQQLQLSLLAQLDRCLPLTTRESTWDSTRESTRGGGPDQEHVAVQYTHFCKLKMASVAVVVLAVSVLALTCCAQGRLQDRYGGELPPEPEQCKSPQPIFSCGIKFFASSSHKNSFCW